MLEATLSGKFVASGEGGNDVTADLADEPNTINWINGHDAQLLWGSNGQKPTGVFAVALDPGIYYPAISNSFSLVSDKYHSPSILTTTRKNSFSPGDDSLATLKYTFSMANYWLARDGNKYGPYGVEDLRRMTAEGTASSSDLLWTEGMSAWQPLFQVVPSLGASTPPPPPPPPGRVPPARPGMQYSTAGSPGLAPLTPPSLHWALVLLLGAITLGIFTWIWCIVQANFVKKLDSKSGPVVLMVFAAIGGVGYLILYFAALGTDNADTKGGLLLISFVLEVATGIFLLVAIFKMRRSLINYYNQVEPINLRLSGVMTFFFSIYYFQHHFTRIAKWKQTGFLMPQ
jgi:uncharacterized protein DUF4339